MTEHPVGGDARSAAEGVDVRDVLHQSSPPDVDWSRVNVAEAVVGVQSPLSWTLWSVAGEVGFRRAFRRLGLIPKVGLAPPRTVAESFMGIFHGHAAFNVTAYTRGISAMPGSSSEATQESFFAETKARRNATSVARKAQARVGLVLWEAVLPWWLPRVRRASHAWWQARVAELRTADEARATAIFGEVVQRMPDETRAQVVASTVVALAHSRLQALLDETGTREIETALIGGYGTTEEAAMAADLWKVARGEGNLDRFLDEYGFHGPAEGELSSTAWREAAAPVRASVAAFTAMGDHAGPEAATRRTVAERVAAERRVVQAAAPRRRWRARLVLWRARRSIPLRVVAKSAFTQTFDVGRAAARVVGGHLVRNGRLSAVDDVFSLTIEELAHPPDALTELVAFRQARRAAYQGVDLPPSWTGMPTPVPLTMAAGDSASSGEPAGVGEAISALGVSAGVTQGTARVMTHPDEQWALEPGEILVCHTTDPSWTSSFVIAAAVVIDIGGTLSHGAIVARELGIPCVVNTINGTDRLRTGDRLKVDGGAGTVEVLARN